MCGGGQIVTKPTIFFIKSTFLAQWTEHPHGIYLLVNLVHSAVLADWKWPILGVVYYRSRTKCVAVVIFIKCTLLPQRFSLIIVHLL